MVFKIAIQIVGSYDPMISHAQNNMDHSLSIHVQGLTGSYDPMRS